MTTQEINTMLYRPILSGNKYKGLFPESECKEVFLKRGNTKVALQEMKKWTLKHYDQTQNVAKALKGENLETTIKNVHDFVYNHFQYAIDETDQLLRSPSCAWHKHRLSGIDCKSFSIISASILLSLGIKCYLRRIKQDLAPDFYTHVYVVIPINQKNPRLNNQSQFLVDYLVIDGTIKDNYEVPFIKKDDLFMNEPALNIVGLASPLDTSCGCNSHNSFDQNPSLGIGLDTILGGGDILGDLGNLFSNLDCIGGSAYSSQKADRDQNRLIEFFSARINDINLALSNQDMDLFSESVNNFLGLCVLSHKTANKKLSEGWNSCTTENLVYTTRLAKYYREEVYNAMTVWLNRYFNKQSLGNFTFQSNAFDSFWFGWLRPVKKHDEQIFQFQIKSTSTSIPFFEITDKIPKPGENFSFNANTFLNSLTNIALEAIETVDNFNNNNNNGGSNQIGDDGNNTNQIDNVPVTSAASISSMAVLTIIGIAGGAYLLKNSNTESNKN